MQIPNLTLLLFLTFFSCAGKTQQPIFDKSISPVKISPTTTYKNIAAIPLPAGYKRPVADINSFCFWLRSISLKNNKAVYLFNGAFKRNQTAQYAVLDISVGKTDLQQCADAVMRLRAEYLFKQKAFYKIIFTDNAGTQYHFRQPYTQINFSKYLNQVFGMCGTASLAKQLITVKINDIAAGDVFVHGGFPGHAEIVVDVAINEAGEKIYLLAQSYMPAQDIHVLNNFMDKNLSPWYKVADNEIIETPEFYFTKYELKKWE